MKRLCSALAVALVLGSAHVHAQSTPAATADRTITVVSGPYMPYLGDGETTEDGFILEIFRTIFEREGYTVRYVVGPWARMLVEVGKGRYDGALLAAEDNAEEYDLFVDTDAQLGELELRFFVKKGDPWRYRGAASLDEVVIGYIYGNPYFSLHDYILKNRNDPNLVQGTGGQDAIVKNLKKLSADRIDLIYEDRLNTIYEAKQLGLLHNIEEAGGLDPATPAYVAWTKRNPRVAEYSRILKEGLRELRTSGELQRILDKYGVQDWEHTE